MYNARVLVRVLVCAGVCIYVCTVVCVHVYMYTYLAIVIFIKSFFRDLPVVTSVQELTFQMVIDNILTPAGVKMGGFPQEMFINLTDDEQQKWACNIWSVFTHGCPHI